MRYLTYLRKRYSPRKHRHMHSRRSWDIWVQLLIAVPLVLPLRLGLCSRQSRLIWGLWQPYEALHSFLREPLAHVPAPFQLLSQLLSQLNFLHLVFLQEVHGNDMVVLRVRLQEISIEL